MTNFAITSSGTRIAYATHGRPGRPVLVLTHSLGSDHHMWEPQVQALEEDYYILSIDNIGHGDSDVPAGDYSLADMADGVLAVAAAEKAERFHYCGLSVGGITGLWLAVHHRERLLSLTLCNTAAKIGAPELWSERIDIARSEGMGALVDGVIARWFSPDFAEREPERFARARATLLATDPTGYSGVCAALRDADMRDDVASITAPTLVIGGTIDQATPIDQARWLHGEIGGSRMVELDAAHLSNLDRDGQFTAALVDFLGANTP